MDNQLALIGVSNLGLALLGVSSLYRRLLVRGNDGLEQVIRHRSVFREDTYMKSIAVFNNKGGVGKTDIDLSSW